MSKTNLLLVTVRADHGGGPRHVDLLINNINRNFNLFVACPDDKPYKNFWQTNSAVKGTFLLPHRKFSFSRLKELSRFIKSNSITVVHSHGKGAGVYTRLLKLLIPSLKVVHTFHGVHVLQYSLLSRNLYYLYEKLMCKLTDRFINVSFGERDICLKHGFIEAKKQITVYNGVPDLAERTSHPAIPDIFKKFKVISISRFDFSKNMQLTYIIAKQLKHNPSIEFVWVGDGADREELENKVKEEGLMNIKFTGFTDQPDIYLKSAQVYLSTSRWEGLPLSLIEAASLSIPVIATDVTGNNEVVKHGFNGFLYDAEAPELAAEYITKLADDPALYTEFAKNSRETYLENFTVEEMVRKTEEIYLS
jgi:glycosyltransferase involved in cell wall biosynthesis